jgi:glucose/mannose-6-phosphate isomerase
VPREYAKITNVVVNGMGGSNLGAHIARSLWACEIKVPIAIAPGYGVPAMVGKNTLYIISSYSGTTEEPLSTYREAKKRGAKIMGITAKGSGRLEALMMKDNLPGYIFSPDYNPSSQPRLGVGYSAFGLAVLLAKAGLFKINHKEMEEVISEMELRTRRLKPSEPLNINAAKMLAEEIYGRIPVLVGAEFTAGILHFIRNVLNECAKSFASYLILPDLNHYAMEGLVNPNTNKKNLAFVFFNSKLYHSRIQRRAALTKEVVEKNGVKTAAYEFTAKTKLEQGFELMQVGLWMSFYLGLLYGMDLAKIPWVDWFKNKLK